MSAGAEEKTAVTLAYPVEIDGAQVSVLQLRRPRVRDLLAADKVGATPVQREIHLFANLCEVAPDAIESLDMLDYGKLQDAYAAFTSGSRTAPA